MSRVQDAEDDDVVDIDNVEDMVAPTWKEPQVQSIDFVRWRHHGVGIEGLERLNKAEFVSSSLLCTELSCAFSDDPL
nr:hypothetical protein [Devosia aurantiaca]